MLRRILLVVMAVAISFGMTACSGYLLYTISEGRSEGHLSLMIRFIFNPAIALLVGVLVGLLSKDHPALTSIVGLVPWILMLHGSRSGGTLSGTVAWIGPDSCLSGACSGFGSIGLAVSARARSRQESECEYRHETFMRGDWDWNIVPEDKAEWIIFTVALLIVLGAALWIFR